MRLVPAAAAHPARVEGIRQDLDRMFERFFRPDFPFVDVEGWTPKVDLSEVDDAYLVRLEAPGVATDDLVIDLDGQTLTISGQRAASREGKDERFVWREREEGTFFRSLRLPAPVESAKVAATSDKGVVTIRLPKRAGTGATRIPVK